MSSARPSTILPARPPAGWMNGFHGTVHAGDIDPRETSTVRELALGRRSLGGVSMRTLTRLPVAAGRSAPTGAGGAAHVGLQALLADAGTTDVGLTVVEVVLDPAPPAAVRTVGWDPDRPLTEYLDVRLGQAHMLLLPNRGHAYACTKRALDLVGAVALLAAAWPVMLVLALLIRLDSPGPALFTQERVTRGGRTFRFVKFRTMYVDARERHPELYSYRSSGGAFDDTFYKLVDDPRNTPVGRWLRRTTLDELPNLFNVLTGSLSLVGPRPELPELVAHYRPEELALFFTKAGLTGLAQVAGRSLLTVRQRLTLDLRYVAHQTLLLDLRILARTVVVVLLRRGAF